MNIKGRRGAKVTHAVILVGCSTPNSPSYTVPAARSKLKVIWLGGETLRHMKVVETSGLIIRSPRLRVLLDFVGCQGF